MTLLYVNSWHFPKSEAIHLVAKKRKDKRKDEVKNLCSSRFSGVWNLRNKELTQMHLLWLKFSSIFSSFHDLTLEILESVVKLSIRNGRYNSTMETLNQELILATWIFDETNHIPKILCSPWAHCSLMNVWQWNSRILLMFCCSILEEKGIKEPNLIERAKEEIKAVISSPRHDKETHGTSDDIDEDTPIDEVKGPSVFERVKEEVEAIVEAIHPKKESRKHESSSE